ncbi:putative G-protein coupled receptor [Wickerhamomyces ciferrii]|uniref:G-protein coupled receptor n=1 Tax=Wickerhamomyces ciferrii (strain ATCC 14091 / BCRC 22168 / CBS 111 / JCM 3599 / NBRC 0793 / NRRL Y-1031 F-60-10) TaxID=1206466 RepID=K0KJ72_WICCF|nr:putative G-protein coupled receptor [Wickerhamomyces ciferrii]CCH41539.1 putative G-protein coupled receptor [Wickerhamomyces ciferrii]
MPLVNHRQRPKKEPKSPTKNKASKNPQTTKLNFEKFDRVNLDMFNVKPSQRSSTPRTYTNDDDGVNELSSSKSSRAPKEQKKTVKKGRKSTTSYDQSSSPRTPSKKLDTLTIGSNSPDSSPLASDSRKNLSKSLDSLTKKDTAASDEEDIKIISHHKPQTQSSNHSYNQEELDERQAAIKETEDQIRILITKPITLEEKIKILKKDEEEHDRQFEQSRRFQPSLQEMFGLGDIGMVYVEPDPEINEEYVKKYESENGKISHHVPIIEFELFEGIEVASVSSRRPGDCEYLERQYSVRTIEQVLELTVNDIIREKYLIYIKNVKINPKFIRDTERHLKTFLNTNIYKGCPNDGKKLDGNFNYCEKCGRTVKPKDHFKLKLEFYSITNPQSKLKVTVFNDVVEKEIFPWAELSAKNINIGLQGDNLKYLEKLKPYFEDCAFDIMMTTKKFKSYGREILSHTLDHMERVS